MRLFKKGPCEDPLKKLSLNSRGQITLAVVWKILAIIFLVVAVVILFGVRGNISNYLAKFYDCMRFGGCFG
ncbi:MAG: hypothetical protein WCI72_01820 [archaeon]